MKAHGYNENTPSKDEFLIIHKILNDPDLAGKVDTMNLIQSCCNPKVIEQYLQGDFVDSEFPDEIIRISENEWLLKKEFEYQYIFTIEKNAGRMKITMREHIEPNCILNIYSCSWTFNEIVAKNSFFSKFEDIDNVIEILKNILGSQTGVPTKEFPKQKVTPKFTFQVHFKDADKQNSIGSLYEDSFISLTFNVLNTNSQLELILFYLEKDEKEKKEEAEKYDEFTNKQCRDLQDEMFELSLKMGDLLQKNQLEGQQIFPDDINDECIKRWKEKNPNKELPKLKPYVEK